MESLQFQVVLNTRFGHPSCWISSKMGKKRPQVTRVESRAQVYSNIIKAVRALDSFPDYRFGDIRMVGV